jgi:osmotically-inducible protein OsmY
MAAHILGEHDLHAPARLQDPHISEAIERHIARRTRGQIDHLAVAVSNGRVILHGTTSSSYARELALLATLEVLGSENPKLVDMYIPIRADPD